MHKTLKCHVKYHQFRSIWSASSDLWKTSTHARPMMAIQCGHCPRHTRMWIRWTWLVKERDPMWCHHHHPSRGHPHTRLHLSCRYLPTGLCPSEDTGSTGSTCSQSSRDRNRHLHSFDNMCHSPLSTSRATNPRRNLLADKMSWQQLRSLMCNIKATIVTGVLAIVTGVLAIAFVASLVHQIKANTQSFVEKILQKHFSHSYCQSNASPINFYHC